MRNISFVSWLLGVYTLELPRVFCEDFLNLCMRYGFSCYDITFSEDGKSVCVKVPANNIKNVKTACRLWQIRIKVVGFWGLPAHVLSYKGRWGLLVGIVVSLAMFFLLQGVVWRIDIVGNERLTNSEIIESLSEQGLSVGSLIRSLDTDSVEQRVMINDDDIAWIAIKIVGTVARVEVREVIDTDVKEKDTKPANIVALYDGQIVSLEIYSGFMNVKEGDFVRAGELLVSGIYKTEKAPVRYSRASGRIMARVNRSFEVEIPLVQTQKVPTGEKIEKKTLIFFGKSIKLFVNYRNLPSTCDIINYLYIFNPFNFGELPISLSVDTYYPYEMKEVSISENEAINKAYEELRRLIDEQMPEAQILSKNLYGEFVDGKYVLKCEITAICNISKTVEFEVLVK